MNNGYAICFKEWILDKDIKNEIQLLLMISNLCAKLGYCYASNRYFANIFDCTEVSISSKINKLATKGYIEIEYKKRGCEIRERKIRLKNILNDEQKTFEPTIKKVFKDNNTSINNNIIKNNNIENKKFRKPEIKEIQSYCLERKNNINAEQFYDFYESKGWKVGNSPMKDWKACVRTWERGRKTANKTNYFCNEEGVPY